MEAPEVLFSRVARAELLEIEAYVASTSGQIRADLVMGRLESAVRSLSYCPGIGRPRVYTAKGELTFPVERWIIIDEPLPNLDGILVLHVIDSRRDLPRLLP
jgi:plasmid stabilization system protein ParE